MRIRTPVEIGLVIREHRRRLGLDQAELARRADVSRQWIVEVEKGKPRAELGLVLKTLEALDLALSVGGGGSGAAAERVEVPDIDAILDDLGPGPP